MPQNTRQGIRVFPNCSALTTRDRCTRLTLSKQIRIAERYYGGAMHWFEVKNVMVVQLNESLMSSMKISLE